MDEETRELLDFWFSPAMRPRWFDSTPALDGEIRGRFEALWRRAAAGELEGWAETPRGSLALAIVLDQLPLNMYRGRPEAFASEARAVAVAKRAIALGQDRELDDAGRLFLYLPLMHSENLDDQNRSVELFRAAGMDTRYPEHHREIVRRFGRFPHRNAILGREDTPAERDYLASPQAFKG